MTYGIFVSFREAANNRPSLRVGATHGEATKPSEASAERLFVSDGAVKHEVRDGEVLRGKAGAVGKRLRR